MRPSHGKNVGGALDQVCRKGLTPLIADIDAVGFANLDSVKARRLTSDGVHPSRSNFDIAITDHPPEKSLRDRTTADIAGANKEDVFHGKATALAAAERT